jgi:transposase InsO family protein
MAVERRGVPHAFVFHSDKGGQYFSTILKFQLEFLGVQQSMGSTGDCFDNAVTESFNAALKKECIYVEPINDFEHAYLKIFNYIEMFYNTKGWRKNNFTYLSATIPKQISLQKQ